MANLCLELEKLGRAKTTDGEGAVWENLNQEFSRVQLVLEQEQSSDPT